MVHRSKYPPKRCPTRFASHTCCQVYPAQVHICRTKPPLQYFPSLWSRESPQGTLDCTVSHARIWYSRKDLNLYLQSSADWCNLLYTTRVKFGHAKGNRTPERRSTVFQFTTNLWRDLKIWWTSQGFAPCTPTCKTGVFLTKLAAHLKIWSR